MDPEGNHNSKSLIFLAIVFLLLVASALLPASWFGVKPTSTYQRLDISGSDDLVAVSNNSLKNSNQNWRDVITSELSTTTKGYFESTPVDAEVERQLDDPSNLTSSFSKNIYLASAYLEKDGGADEATQQKIISTLMADEKAKIVIKTYTSKDIVISKVDNADSQKKYGNALGTLLTKLTKADVGVNDVAGIRDYIQDQSKVQELSTYSTKKKVVDEVIASLTVVPVPQSATPYHLLALNRLEAYSVMLDGFSKANTDPIRANILFNDYIPTAKALYGALTNMKEYFKAMNISFSKTDPGYVFSLEYTK